MSTGYVLLDTPNRACPQLSTAPRELSGVIVMHTAESAPDWVGPDTSAEAVASWITRRDDPGSYHQLIDSDSTVPMAPWWAQTWHDKVTNPHSVGISFATKAHLWPKLPPAHRDAMLRRGAAAAADAARYIKRTRGIDVPARWLTQAEAWARKPGFVRHADSERVPGRRSDPWPADSAEAAIFLAYYSEAMGHTAPTPTPEENETMYLIRSDSGAVSLINDELTKAIGITNPGSIDGFTKAGVPAIQLAGADYANILDAIRGA